MTKKTYPEDIYKDFPTCGSEQSNIAAHAAGRQHAYNMGFNNGYFARHQAKSLTGWSNLTEAIKAGERIDWERLDGLEVKCVHPELGTLTHRLERDICYLENSFSGWYLEPVDLAWENAILEAWQGTGGWTLYIKGDLPLRKLTADQLEPGTCFKGKHPEVCEGEAVLCVVIGQANGLPGRVVYPGPTISRLASEVEVVEVYGVGTFQTPEGDA